MDKDMENIENHEQEVTLSSPATWTKSLMTFLGLTLMLLAV